MILWRVILAMYLAIWSPAICCCTIKSAMGGEPCGASESACCARVVRESQASCCKTIDESPSCCEEEALSCSVETDESGSSPQSKCRCHEKSIDRLDTVAKIAAMAHMSSFVASAIEPHSTFCLIVTEARPAEVMERSHPPPLTSLVAQRCLLLI